MDIGDTDITNVVLRGVVSLGQKIREGDPSFYHERISLSSDTHVFDWPSDCMGILKVWDLGTTAKTITGAADNGSGAIRITSAAHGFDDDDIVQVHSVAGCTEANSYWKVDNSATNTFDLYGSTFSNTYTSGGSVYKIPTDPDEIRKIQLADATGARDDKWYPRQKTIVVDDVAFDNDLLVDYEKRPSAITDIPAEYHEGLVGFGIVNLIDMPAPDNPEYAEYKRSRDNSFNMWQLVWSQIDETFGASTEPSTIRDTWQYETDNVF